ncbi:MAG: cell wall-binding repeat-containing protein [Coriobacteriia bacterium]|nr:cell wall-binding repeat-containing protein [Coriobacteriia bacterium]
MSRARLTRGGAVVWRASCVAAGLAMLVALFPASAPALVNDGAHLDVGAGETITLDGEHRYSESIVVHDGGVVRVGPSGSLILRAPAIYLRDGGIITGAGTASSPNGKTIVLECDTFTILTSGGSVVADGANATSSSNAGNGGSIHIRAAESATLASGTISACGGAGYSSTYYALAGAGGGQIVVRSRNLTMSGSGTRIRASGGDGGDNFEGTTGANGGPGGSIRLYGASVAFGPIVDASGGDGGDAVFHAAGEGGNGGAGGSVAAAWCSRSGTEALDVSGGAAGTGNLRNGIPGPVGTATSTTGVDAQFDPSHTTDGYIEPESQHEYPQSWMWSSTTGGVPLTVWLCQDGFGLYVALRNNSDNERSYDVFIDVNGDGSSAPGTDDLWLTVGPTSALTERRGNGSAWVTQPSASGWSAVATRKWIFPGGYYIREAEFSIPFAKLGLTAGQVKTMRMAIGARPGTAPNLWPSTASDTQPSTWPRLTSVDSWTAFRNVAPGVPPGGWDVSPLVATITVPTPDLAVLVRDHIAGTKPGTAQYRFSTDGGSSWTPWTDAANTLTYWNESTQTVRADDVPLPDSMTNNRVQFRVTDMGGLTGTSPIVTVRKDASSPGGWTSFSPATVVRTTLTPDCTVRVQDVCSGLAVASAEYRYSTDGGTTWSAWSPAACTGTNGTTAQQTITADDVQFQRNSATANKVQFRVRDLAGNLGTSAIYTVAIDAPILGLPPNGSFEVGLPGQIPSLWTASGQPYLDDNPPTSLWAWSAHAVAGHGYDGQQAVHGRIWIGAVVWNPLTGFSRIQMLGRGDLSGAGFLELYMKDVSTGENDPTDIIPWYECRIDAVLTDGTNTVTRPLYVNNTGSVTDSRVATAPGTDGAVWSRYVVPVNDPALDETSLTVGVRWQVRTGNLDVARAPVIGQTAVFSESKVDVVRALDAVAPTSSGSVLGEFWTPYSRRQISWSASDNSGLSKIEFWARSDPGSGFGPWTKIGERTITGYLAAGTTELDLGGPGISEVYTIARDIDGNAEAPPARADDSCGIDKAAPGSWSSFQPSGWVASRTVDCSVTVHDPLSGIRSAPVRVGVTRDLPQTAGPTTWVDQRFVWVGAGTAVCAVDAADPRAPEVVNSVDITKARVFDLKRAPGRKAVAACGDDGLVVLDAADPSQPKTVGASADAPAVSVHAVDLAGIAPRSPLALTADGTSGILTVWGISNPAAPARLSSIDLGAPLRLIAAADGVPAAFCATGSDLVAINLSDPARPEVLDALELKADLVSLATDGRTVYAADEDGVLWAVPWNAGFGIPQNAPSSATGPIAFVDSHAYVADAGDGGLCVVEHVPPAEPWSEHDVPGPSPAASVDATHGIVALAEASRLALYVHGEPMWSFSRDEGLTWSAWAPALDPLGDTNAPATLTAPAVPFGQDSATKNLVRYRAGDAVGWLAESTPFAVRIDTEVGMPTISSSTHPTSAWSANNDPAFSWTPPADLSGIVGYSYLLAPDLVTEPDTISEGSGTATTYADVPDGSWYFRVRARDAAGNWGGAAAKLVRIDTTPPSGTMALAGGAAWTTTRTVSVDSTVTDALSGVWQMRFSTDGGTTWGAWQPYAASASVTLPSGDGTKTVAAQYRDAAGNVLALVDDIRLESFRHLEPGAQRVDRWSGDDRFKTAVAISSNSFARAETVVIATGRTFPDALSASALAGTVNGPLLLTDSTSLPTAVRNEIVRLGARRVYIVGGTGAVSSAVETAVAQVPGITAVQRIYGADRYATAAAVCAQVAQLQGPAFCRRAFVARGDDFPDALAAAPVAFAQKMPVLLVKPTSLPDPTRSAITTNRITECIVVGDTGAVSDDVKNQIKNLGVITDRWKGLTRFSTAVEVARNAVLRGWCRWDFVGVAWGRNFPDALSGGVGTGAYRGVLLMSETTSLPPETQAALSANKTSIVGARIFGGTGAVSDGVKNSVANAIKLE